MEGQENNFLGTGAFGIQSASIISDATADLIFGPSVTANAKDATAIVTDEDPDKKKKPVAITNDILKADDIFDALGIDNNKDKVTEKSDIDLEPELVQNEPQINTFEVLRKELINLGVFNQDQDEKPISTPEEFRDRFIREKQVQVEKDIYNFLTSKHGQEGVEAFDDIFVKGVSPKDYLAKFNTIQSLKDLDITNPDNQEKVMREVYRRQGLKQDAIDRKVQRAKEYGDLEEESKDFHELLIEQEQEDLKEQVAQSAAKQQSELVYKQEYANTLNTILGNKLKQKDFDGIPVTEKVARETYDYLVSEKWVLPNGEKLTDFDKDILDLRDMKNLELKLKIGLLMKNKLDLTKVKTKAVSNESERLFSELITKETQIKKQNKIVPTRGFLNGL